MKPRRIGIVGLGLMGASLALSLKGKGFAQQVVGFDVAADTVSAAQRGAVIDQGVGSIADLVAHSDLMVLAVPVGAMHACLLELSRQSLPAHLVVTDVGSTKCSVIRDVEQVFGVAPAWFVPGHPIAGGELSGLAAGRGDLFCDKRVILTPTANTAEAARRRVEALWEASGAKVEMMDATRHDALMAFTSHMPHVLAYAMVECMAAGKPEGFVYAGGGFRDFTRIAASDPVMWRDICLNNRSALLAALDRFESSLGLLRQAIDESAGSALEQHFAVAKGFRDSLNREPL